MTMEVFSARDGIEKIYDYTVEHVEAEIIVNANESNYPMPEPVKDKLKNITEDFPFNRYPPVKSEYLAQAIADELEISVDNIKIGNGAGDILQKVCYAFGGSGRKIAFPATAGFLYRRFVDIADSVEAPYETESSGALDADAVIEFCKKTEPALLILCNPHNPTGAYSPLSTIEKILAHVKCPVVVDETYIEFAGGREVDALDLRPLNKIWLVAGSVLTLNGKYSNAICVRSFSKAYGIAGVRCGYAVGCAGIMRILGKVIMPYSVSAYTLMAAKAVYEYKHLYKDIIKTVVAERNELQSFLRQEKFQVWDSGANFVLFRPGSMTGVLSESYREVYGENKLSELSASGKFIYRYLLQNGILAADFSEDAYYQGCIRLTVGTPEENKKIKEKLKMLKY